MNDILPDLPASPTQVGNFVIAYQQEIEFITEDFKLDELLHFIQTDENVELFAGQDASFFPRAVTDFDIEDFVVSERETEPDQFDIDDIEQTEVVAEPKSNRKKFDYKMEGDSEERNKAAKSFQPDVIVSNSHQRSGPDGSPALIPSQTQSQGFLPSNLSDTGDLFAPVKTLTFSDVDQYSQVDDSVTETSRYVSTPDKPQTRAQYDYDIPGNYGACNNNAQDNQVDSDSDSDDHVHIEPRERSSEFRQLEGEPDLDLMSTGAFHPSAHGLNQEFMENFTGKTGAMYPMGSIFSPLGAGEGRQQEKVEAKTPPLHVPSGNGPFTIHLGQKAPVQNHNDPDEIQFQMSPRNLTGSAKASRGYMMINRQEYMNSDRSYQFSYPNEHTFEPIDKQPQNFMSQNTIPKNLEEYVNQDARTHHASGMKTKSNQKHINKDMPRVVNRQGDGYEQERQEGVGIMMQAPDEIDHQYSAVTQSAFEQRYLQRTQVSVKLPQATYDTMTHNTMREERAEPDDQKRSSISDHTASASPERRQREQHHMAYNGENFYKASPAKADQSQEQPSNSKQKNVPKEHLDDNNATNNANDNNAFAGKSTQRKYSSDISDDDNKQYRNEQVTQNSKYGEVVSESASESSAVIVTSKTQLGQTGVAKSQSQSRNIKQAGSQSTQSSQQSAQSQQPSTRLMQETISQKSKVNHKYVSNIPGVGKAASGQSKDTNKTQEPAARKPNTNSTIAAGARKSSSDSDKIAQVKSKSVSMECLNQKQRTGQSQNTYRPGSKPDQNPSRSREGHQKKDLGARDQGQHRGAQGQSSPGVDPREESHVVTQVQTTSPVSVDLAERSMRGSQVAAQSSIDVRGMEEVRSQLQSMLRLSHDTMPPQDRSQYEHSDIVAGFGMDMGDRPVDMSWNMISRKAPEDNVSELFPSFSSSQFMSDSGNVSRSDASLHSENQRLRDMVDKERYRRKHCEQYIQQLNVKLLETQQQVAVAVSTDQRKDIMIEQLDKQLAVVMEGWKKRDLEKDAMVEELRKEKEEIEANMAQQQQMINNFEHDMSQAVDALREEKERSVQSVEELKEKLDEVERLRARDREAVAAEQEKAELLQQECESLRESREALDKKLDTMQRRLHREQDEWFQREQELLQRIEEVSEKNTKILQQERAKNEEQGKLAEELMEQYQAAATKIKHLEMELDAAMREKESVKVEMGIMEAKFENAQRVLEAEMHSTMEKQITDQIADVQARNERNSQELQERHRHQVVELTQRHGREMEKQLAVFRDEVAKKEDDFRKQLNEMEARLTDYRNENSELKLSKQKLESTRIVADTLIYGTPKANIVDPDETAPTGAVSSGSTLFANTSNHVTMRLEILTKLQYAMQTQWNEAFSLLSSTPQRKGAVPTLHIEPAVSTSDGDNQALPSVSFSFASPSNTSANQNSQHRTLTNQNSQHSSLTNHSSPPRSLANQIGIHEKSSSNQNSPDRRTMRRSSLERLSSRQHSPERKADRSRSTPSTPDGNRTGVNADVTDDLSIETTTMLHMQQFQDYMNSVARTPEWISTINTQPPPPQQQLQQQQQQQQPDLAARHTPTLPQPPDLAALLASHLHNMHQQHMQNSSLSSLRSHPNPAQQSTLAMHNDNSSASLGSEPNTKSLNYSGASNVTNVSHRGQTRSPQKDAPMSVTLINRSEVSESRDGINHSSRSDLGITSQSNRDDTGLSQSHRDDASFGWSLNPGGRGISLGDAPDLSCAVPIRPPQQGEDPYPHDDDQSVISSIVGSHTGYFQGGQSFSPPTKQSAVGQDDSLEEDFSQHTSRLHADYSQLSQKMEQHESHQNELQHYIQMLLTKPASESGHNDSMYSQATQDELDLNDMAQAAQLQRELDRIQELRQKQELSSKPSDDQKLNNTATGGDTSKILTDQQMAEISRLLAQVKGRTDPNSSQVMELLELLKHTQESQARQKGPQGQRKTPRDRPAGATQGAAAGGGARDKSRGQAQGQGLKKSVHFNPAKGVEGTKQSGEKTQADKQQQVKGTQSQSAKKVERKVAGSSSKGDKGPKPAAWK